METALSEHSRGFVVEFAGLPGSGKSTLAHALAARLRQISPPVSEPSYELNHRARRWQRVATKLACILRCLVAHPIGSAAAALAIAKTRQRSIRDLLNTTFNMLYVCGLRQRVARRPGIHVLDQSVVQQVWSVRFSASRPVPMKGLARLGRACFGVGAGVVVFVDVKPATIMERLATRRGAASRLERRLARESRHAELAAAEDALAEARGAVGSLVGSGGRIEMLTVTNEDGEDAETTASALALRVRDWSAPAEPYASGGGHGG